MNLWHSIVAPIEAKDKLGIDDDEILDAIRWHTTGKEDMSTLTKIIYIADMIEPGRNFDGVDEIKILLARNLLIDENTIKARNYFLFNPEFKL
jgi:predicted HD superfamily hydrolase involved in NAD metabolism